MSVIYTNPYSLIPPIVANGLVFNVDAGDSTSYPGTGTTWTDLSGNGNNGTLINGGPAFNSADGGNLIFDGVNDYVSFGNIMPSTYTKCIFFKIFDFPTVNNLIAGGDLGNHYLSLLGVHF